MLAAIRPSDWELPLFLHVAGAMLLVGALLTSLVLAGVGAPARSTLRSLLWGALPAYLLMRVSAQWIFDKEGFADVDEAPAWIDIGFITSEPQLLLILASVVVAGLATRREATGGAPRAVAIMMGIAIALSLVAVWAMVAKPA